MMICFALATKPAPNLGVANIFNSSCTRSLLLGTLLWGSRLEAE